MHQQKIMQIYCTEKVLVHSHQVKSSEVHLHGYSSAFPRTRTRPAVSQLCFETIPYPHLPHARLSTYCLLVRSSPLLPKVRHDVVDVGFILSPPILRPRRSLVGCIISFVLRVPLHLHPACYTFAYNFLKSAST